MKSASKTRQSPPTIDEGGVSLTVSDSVDFFDRELPREEWYYWFVAIGIVSSWIGCYLVAIIILLPFAQDSSEAPRYFYVGAILFGLVGPVIFLVWLWNRNNSPSANPQHDRLAE